MYHIRCSRDTPYTRPRVRARVSSCICTCTRDSGCIVHAAATARTALRSLAPPHHSPSLVLVPVFMRVSMGKGSATRTRRKIISDLPRARRSCRPPYIARRSVLRRIFEMETHSPCPDPPTRRRDSASATFVRRNSKRKKREREREVCSRRVCSEIGCDRKS